MKGTESGIRRISQLSEKEQGRGAEPFEYWGATPAEARRAAVEKRKGLHDKRTTLKEAVGSHVKDGMSIGVGGFVNTRTPIALIHEILRQGCRNVTLAMQSNSLCVELFAAAMILDPGKVSIDRVELAFWGYEIIGIAPMFRHLTSRGLIQVDDYTNYGMSARFKAAAYGIPFIPTRDHGGSDMELVNRGKLVECPFSGDNVYLVPACHPDVALIHTQVADRHGNARIFGALGTCPEMAMAAKHTILTAERIIPNESIRRYPNLTEIPYMVVDAVVEQPLGAYPGAVYGCNWFDMDEILEFRRVCEVFRKNGDRGPLKDYFDAYIYGCGDHDDYIATRPYKKLKSLKIEDQGQPILVD